MIRKCMTTLLALLLAVMLPLCALADTQHTLTIIPGDDLAGEQAIVDLLDVLSFTLTLGDESGALSVGLSGQDMLTVAASADNTGLYVHSNILSDDVLYITWEDGIAVFSQLAAAEMGEEQALLLQQNMEQTLDMVTNAVSAGSGKTPFITTPQESIENLKAEYADDPAMVEFIEKTYGPLEEEEGSFTADNRDTANRKQTMTMNSEGFDALCETRYMRNLMEGMVKMQNPELSSAELDKAVDEMIAQVREIYRNMQMDGVITAYYSGEDLVGMEVDAPLTMTIPAEDGTEQTLAMNISTNYNRLTDNNGVSHQAGYVLDMPETLSMEAAFDLYKGADGVSEGALAILVGGEEVTITYDASNDGNVRTRLAEVYLRSGATSIIEPAASARPLFGFQVVTQPADPAVLDKIEAADSNTAVNVLKLSEEEMNTLVTDIEARAMQIVFTAMGSLPASAMTLLMNSQF